MKAVILINIEMGEIKQVVRDLRRIHHIHEVQATFGLYDAIAIVEVPELQMVGRIVATEIQPIPGILKTCTCLMVEGELPPADIYDDFVEGENTQLEGKNIDPAFQVKVEHPFGFN